MDRVVDKDGQVDYLSMNQRTIRSFKSLLRGLGGASINEVVELPSGATVPAYGGTPIFRNDYIPTNQTTGGSTTTTTFFARPPAEGGRPHGHAALHPARADG